MSCTHVCDMSREGLGVCCERLVSFSMFSLKDARFGRLDILECTESHCVMLQHSTLSSSAARRAQQRIAAHSRAKQRTAEQSMWQSKYDLAWHGMVQHGILCITYLLLLERCLLQQHDNEPTTRATQLKHVKLKQC